LNKRQKGAGWDYKLGRSKEMRMWAAIMRLTLRLRILVVVLLLVVKLYRSRLWWILRIVKRDGMCGVKRVVSVGFS
jgi:hypothetical protein